jgi:hypothetical protein
LAELREKLAASKAAAVAAKEEFASRYVRGRDNVAVGIGLNRARDAWAVKVFVQSPSDTAGLPDHFRDYEVDVQVAGRANAYSA